MNSTLTILPGVYAVAKFDPKALIPEAIYQSHFYAVSRSVHEISVICEEANVPLDCVVDKGWKLLEFKGTIDEGLIGIVASIAKPLADAGIGIIAHTTYDAGYFGVKAKDLDRATKVLKDWF